jgi:hypothetical protein
VCDLFTWAYGDQDWGYHGSSWVEYTGTERMGEVLCSDFSFTLYEHVSHIASRCSFISRTKNGSYGRHSVVSLYI